MVGCRATSPASFEVPSDLMYVLPGGYSAPTTGGVLIDEDVVRPVDADVVDLVLAVAQLPNAVDDAPEPTGLATEVLPSDLVDDGPDSP